MKIITMLLFCATLLATSCKKDDDQANNPIDALPPATQVGAQTFGCLVDGEVFLPKDIGGNRLGAFYQNIAGRFFLGITSNSESNNKSISISIQGMNLEMIEENEYELGSEEDAKLFAVFIKGFQNELIIQTTNLKPGSIVITNHDIENFILSGTFEFTVTDERGTEIKVTDGRFDLKYTN
jgi:hypothetical protein